LDVVNNRPFTPICLFQRLFLGRSGLFRLHQVWWTRRVSNFVTYLHEPATKQRFQPNVSHLYPRKAPLQTPLSYYSRIHTYCHKWPISSRSLCWVGDKRYHSWAVRATPVWLETW
jgi:hypothetical protein